MTFESATGYEESPNYDEAFICIGFGVVFLAIALFAIRLGARDLHRVKLLSFFVGFCLCCYSVACFVRSTICLDRESQALTIRHSLLGISWGHQYPIKEIEQFFEAMGQGKDQRLLAVELTNGRTTRLNLWAKKTSLSAEEERLTEVLERFRPMSISQ